MNIKITIHTATYNRAYILPKAYESLKKQTCKEFEWIITDDGSEDNTEELVKQWQKEEAGFNIIYNKLCHVGIPRALNSGISKATTEWFMMLDSDDFLLPVTVEKVISWLSEIENDQDFAGIGFARSFPNGEYMKPQIPLIEPDIGFVDATHLERAKYHLNMDMCEVHRVELLKKYPFQYYKNEKYAPEQLNFYMMAFAGYKLRWRSDRLYICEYLPDGQTKDDSLVKHNPMGFAMMYNQNILIDKSLKSQFINCIRMTALCIYAKELTYLHQSNNKWMTFLSFPTGLALAKRREKQYKELR